MSKRYSNQKRMVVKKHSQGLYTTMDIKALSLAVSALSGEAFKLWCYLNKNQDGYAFNLSKADALRFGIGSESSYNRAVKSLIEKGYIKKYGDQYIFFENIEENRQKEQRNI